MKSVLRPYADLPGVFRRVEYRSSPADAFAPLDVNGDTAARVVSMDDLRTIPTHQFKVDVDLDVLKPHYTRHVDKIRFAVLVRDTVLRSEIVLADFPLDQIPPIVEIERERLRLTGLRDLLTISLIVVWRGGRTTGVALPTQTGSRLAELHVSLKNAAGGASFPYKKVSVAQLRAERLPSETAVYLKLFGDPVELLKGSDTPISSLCEIWIHEKVWGAMQSDRIPATAQLRMAAVTLAASQQLLSATLPALKSGERIDDRSAIGQLLSYVERQGGLPVGKLRRLLEGSGSLQEIDPHLQHTWRFATSSSRVEEEFTE
jgi:hypothetical protein